MSKKPISTFDLFDELIYVESAFGYLNELFDRIFTAIDIEQSPSNYGQTLRIDFADENFD